MARRIVLGRRWPVERVVPRRQRRCGPGTWRGRGRTWHSAGRRTSESVRVLGLVPGVPEEAQRSRRSNPVRIGGSESPAREVGRWAVALAEPRGLPRGRPITGCPAGTTPGSGTTGSDKAAPRGPRWRVLPGASAPRPRAAPAIAILAACVGEVARLRRRLVMSVEATASSRPLARSARAKSVKSRGCLPERPLHTVCHRRVAAIQHGGEQVAQQRDRLRTAPGTAPASPRSRPWEPTRTRSSRPVASPSSATASANVSSRGPVTSYIWPTCRSSVSAATATSAMSSASTNGSSTSPTGSATVPAATSSAKLPSLKFCANQDARMIVHSRPDDRTTSSAACGLLLAAAGQEDQPRRRLRPSRARQFGDGIAPSPERRGRGGR